MNNGYATHARILRALRFILAALFDSPSLVQPHLTH